MITKSAKTTLAEQTQEQGNSLRNALLGAASIAGLGAGGLLLRKQLLRSRGVDAAAATAKALPHPHASSYAGGNPLLDPARKANAAAAATAKSVRKPGPVSEAAEPIIEGGFNTPFADLQAKMKAARN